MSELIFDNFITDIKAGKIPLWIRSCLWFKSPVYGIDGEDYVVCKQYQGVVYVLKQGKLKYNQPKEEGKN
ncbi:MAG: hypothetical protein WC677_08400 [Clostridia bacterium]|jgi:hypothetical protein